MQNSEKLCLKWNDFQENLNLAFQGLRNDQDLSDVTLVCEDGTQIKTHKVILASSSPFFMEILKKNNHPHPLIYMRGIKAEELVAIVDFLYFGEANVKQESLDAFLGLAEELRLKGLTESNTKDQLRNKTTIQEMNVEDKERHDQKFLHITKLSNLNKFEAKTESSSVALVSVEAHQLDDQIKSMMTRTEKDITMGKQTGKAYACNECGKEGQWANIKTHIESNHIANNISHTCDICGKIFWSRNRLRLHKAKEHFK